MLTLVFSSMIGTNKQSGHPTPNPDVLPFFLVCLFVCLLTKSYTSKIVVQINPLSLLLFLSLG
jgi:hypothetical protein